MNRRLTPLEEAFSGTLGEASRRTQTILEVALVLTAMLLVLLGAAMSRRMLRASENLEAQLFAERDRAQVTLRSIAEGVIATDLDGRVETLNTAAQTLTGWRGDEAIGEPLGGVFRILEDADGRGGIGIDPMATLLREAATVEWRGNTVLLRRDGTTVDVDVSAAPIRDRDGAIIGAVFVFYDVTDDRRFTAQLSHQARHDALTGLPNRREFEHRLARALSDAATLDRRHAVLFLDLDRFKEVNDTSGHAAGDALLREIGAVLSQSFAEATRSPGWRRRIRRAAGDCPPESALRIAETLRAAVADFRFEAQDRRFDLGVSIGLVPITEAAAFLVSEVIGAADACCYGAKGSGRNRVCVYQSGDDHVERRRRG